MPEIDTVRAWEGRTMLDRDGDRIGTIDAIYLDDQTGQLEWALVCTGLFGGKATFVPLARATQTGAGVQVPYSKQLVKDAPQVYVDQHLSGAEEQQLWRHYGMKYETADRHVATGDDATNRGTVGRDVSGPTTDDAMTRSGEELRVGTTQRERGRVRLRKYVTTEHVQQTVPVQREEAPVVEKRAVPRERVRLDGDTVTGEERVAEQVRKEQIEVHDQDERGGRHERPRR